MDSSYDFNFCKRTLNARKPENFQVYANPAGGICMRGGVMEEGKEEGNEAAGNGE